MIVSLRAREANALVHALIFLGLPSVLEVDLAPLEIRIDRDCDLPPACPLSLSPFVPELPRLGQARHLLHEGIDVWHVENAVVRERDQFEQATNVSVRGIVEVQFCEVVAQDAWLEERALI